MRFYEKKVPTAPRMWAAFWDGLTALAVAVPGLIQWDNAYRMLQAAPESPESTRAFWCGTLWIAAAIIYFLIRDGFGGRGPGKRLTGLIVLDRRTGKPANIRASLIRNAVMAVLGIIPFIGWAVEPLAYFLHPQGLRIGDRLAKTQVMTKKYYQDI